MTEAPESAVEPVEAAPVDQLPPEPVEAVEDKARRLGWRPKEEFRGDETRWIDADTFVKRGEEVLPIIQANNKALEKEVANLKKTLKEFSAHHSQVEQRAYKAALRDLEARQAAAVEANDLGEVREITREIADLGREAAPTNREDPALTDWKDENPWFGKDPIMRAAAVAIVDGLIADGVTNLDRQLSAVDKRIREEFPHKFTNPRRSQAAAVEGSSTPRRTPGKTLADLPPEARAAAIKWDKQGILPIAQYLKEYQW